MSREPGCWPSREAATGLGAHPAIVRPIELGRCLGSGDSSPGLAGTARRRPEFSSMAAWRHRPGTQRRVRNGTRDRRGARFVAVVVAAAWRSIVDARRAVRGRGNDARSGSPRRGPLHTGESLRGNPRLRVRRLQRGSAPIGPVEGERVVRAAAGLFDHRYSYSSIARLLFFQPGLANPSAFFCSTFVGVVYSLALKVLLERLPVHRPLMPATLVLHSQLTDVDLEWRLPL